MSRIVKYRKNSNVTDIKFYDVPATPPNVVLNGDGSDIDEYTVAMLHFDESATKDECGNSWSTSGYPTFGITLGGQDFTIDSWFYYDSSTTIGCRPFFISNNSSASINSFIGFYNGDSGFEFWFFNKHTTINFNPNASLNHYTILYLHSQAKAQLYINGTKMAELSVSGNTITVNSKPWDTADGSLTEDSTFTVTVAADSEYEAISKTFTVKNYHWGALNQTSPEQIQTAVRLGIAPLLWSVGDVTAGIAIAKTNLGTYVTNGDGKSHVNYIAAGNYYAKILGFDHSSDLETAGSHSIHFAIGCSSDGTKDLAFVENLTYYELYGLTYDSSYHKSVLAHKTTASNSGGWNSSKIKTFLNGTLLSNIDNAWTAVMADVTKYTDNTGNKSTSEANVTATTDKLFLLSLYEVFGSVNGNGRDTQRCNPYEANYQQQYDYYKNGASKIRYKHNATGTESRWWFRNPSLISNAQYSDVTTTGNDGTPYANYSYGVVPCFAIA